MARLNSFYLAPARWREPFVLDGEEALHLIRVLRARVGGTIRLMDGQGRSGQFRIVAISKKDAVLEPLSEQVDPEPTGRLTLAMGWSKGVRRGFLLEKSVELGASAVWFWQARHSQGEVPDEDKETWERQLIAAAKQCGATWLPAVRTFAGPTAVIEAARGVGSRVLCWEGERHRLANPMDLCHPHGAVAVLGPEGGLDEEEVRLFTTNGFVPVSLGPHILRYETAALFVLSLGLWADSRAQGDASAGS